MFLLLSFIVAILSLYFLFDIATSTYYTSEPNAAAAVALLIFSLVCIIRELKERGDEIFDYDCPYNDRIEDYDRKYNYHYNNDYITPTIAVKDNHNDWLDKYGSKSRKVEVFAPNASDKKDKDERPMVWHYPSKKEARDKIAKLEKSFWWRAKRRFFQTLGIDITSKYYKPSYVKEEVAVKGGKENPSRFMPKQSWLVQRENEEYNKVVSSLGRSCDIAFEGEDFVDEITVTKDGDKKPKHCGSCVNNI